MADETPKSQEATPERRRPWLDRRFAWSQPGTHEEDVKASG